MFYPRGLAQRRDIRRLREVEKPLASFFASGVFNLREKLGPFLWQFPPRMQYDAARFFELLARTLVARLDRSPLEKRCAS